LNYEKTLARSFTSITPGLDAVPETTDILTDHIIGFWADLEDDEFTWRVGGI
jgi:hypothetical protein